MIEIISKVVEKIHINIYKLLNYNMYKNGVFLYGVPKILMKKNVEISRNVRINENVFIHGAGGVKLEENVTLSYGVTILSTGYDVENWGVNKISKRHKNERVTIGRNVWVGANVTILPGVKIKKDVIIAAGAVVVKDVNESGYVYGGIPANKIKKIRIE